MSEEPQVGYQPAPCSNCARYRVEWDGKQLICEKCGWDQEKGEYVVNVATGEKHDAQELDAPDWFVTGERWDTMPKKPERWLVLYRDSQLGDWRTWSGMHKSKEAALAYAKKGRVLRPLADWQVCKVYWEYFPSHQVGETNE